MKTWTKEEAEQDLAELREIRLRLAEWSDRTGVSVTMTEHRLLLHEARGSRLARAAGGVTGHWYGRSPQRNIDVDEIIRAVETADEAPEDERPQVVGAS